MRIIELLSPTRCRRRVRCSDDEALTGGILVRELRRPAFRGRVIVHPSLVTGDEPAAHHVPGVAAILQKPPARPAIVRQLGASA